MTQTIVKKLSTRHQLMMYDMVFNGMGSKEVADKHGLTLARLNVLRRSPLWIKEEDKVKREVLADHKEKLGHMIPKAMDTLNEVVGSTYVVKDEKGEEKVVMTPPATRVQAAAQILDRTGMKEQEQGQTGGVTIQLYAPGYATDDGKGKIIDVEIEEKDDAI